MNPLNKIGKGIEEQDWGLVCEGYNIMAGQQLLVPPQQGGQNPLSIEVPCSESTLQLFKDCLLEMIKEFDFIVNRGHNTGCEPIDEPDTECDVSQPVNDDDTTQSEDDDDEEEFDEVIETGEKVGLYGNRSVLVTEQPTPARIEANKKRAAERSVQKVSRPPPKTYEVECTDCEKPFESRMRPGKFGQKCSKCLKSTNRDR